MSATGDVPIAAGERKSQAEEPVLVATAWRSDGEIVAVATREEIWLYTASNEPITELSFDTGLEPVYLTWHPGESKLVAVAFSRAGNDWIYIWSVTGSYPNVNVTVDRTIEIFSIGLGRVAWSSDTRLAVTHGSGEIDIWDTATGTILKTLRPEEVANIDGIAWSPDDLRLAVGLSDDSVRVWNMTTYQIVATLEGQSPSGLPNWLTWSPSGDQLAAICSWPFLPPVSP